MPDDEDNDQNEKGFSFGRFTVIDNKQDEENVNNSDEDSEETRLEEKYSEEEINEIKTLESTLERREEQVKKLKQKVKQLENSKGTTDDTVDTDKEETTSTKSTESTHQSSELRMKNKRLEEKVEELSEENDELKRALSGQKNKLKKYKQRTNKKVDQAQSDAVANIVKDLSSVRDSLMAALSQDESTNLRTGIESTLNTLDDVLRENGLVVIEPDSGDTLEPEKHQVVHKKETTEYPKDEIVELYTAGYEYNGRVIQPARVTISKGAPDDPVETSDGEDVDNEDFDAGGENGSTVENDREEEREE